MSATTFMSAGGPLAPYAAGYRGWLAGQGYLPGPARRQLRLFAHLSGWLAVSGAGADALAGECLVEYAAVRRADGQFLYSARALAPLLRYLRELGVLPEVAARGPEGPLGDVLAAFHRYLAEERGLARFTTARYEYWARRFLSRPGGLLPGQLRAADVHGFVAASCRELSVPAAKQMVSALRALLQFLHVSGVTGRELAGAVPGVPGWSLSHLPKGLRPAEVAGLLGVCDRTTRTGVRDYAVLCLLSRLGLRAGEIAALCLEDVDWRRGELLVRGKGRREERLPLPADAGAALAGYVRSGRPAGQRRELFLRVRAPGGPLGRSGVSAIVVRAGRAAGIAGAGAHRLRHSVATELLGQGATLAEVGQVLRHSSASSTAIYAKVDRLALAGLGLPWPGSAS
jgi:site-specific recombinase XerD